MDWLPTSSTDSIPAGRGVLCQESKENRAKPTMPTKTCTESKLDAAFLLTVVLGSFSAYKWSLFTYNWNFFPPIEALLLTGESAISSSTDCNQRSSTVSKTAPTVSKKASPNKCLEIPIFNFRGQKLNTNIFLELFGPPQDIRSKIPRYPTK